MTKLDQVLARIGDLPLDPRLSGIDDAVFAGLAEATCPAVPRAAFGAIIGVAMMAGVLATASPGRPVRHGDSTLLGTSGLLGTPGALAPSTLLGVGN